VCCATACVFFITGRLPSKSGGAAYRRIHHCLLRSVFSNVIIYNVTTATSSTNERYVQRVLLFFLFSMFYEYMFSYCLFSFSMLFNTSSMFELHMVVATVVIFNILKLIIEIVPNYPADSVST
jgi:hypothetical protein